MRAGLTCAIESTSPRSADRDPRTLLVDNPSRPEAGAAGVEALLDVGDTHHPKPMLLFRLSGWLLLRKDARALS